MHFVGLYYINVSQCVTMHGTKNMKWKYLSLVRLLSPSFVRCPSLCFGELLRCLITTYYIAVSIGPSFRPSIRLLVLMLKKFSSFLYFIEARLFPCGSLRTDSSKSHLQFFCLYTLNNLKSLLKYPTHHSLSSPCTLTYIVGWLYQVCFICFPVWVSHNTIFIFPLLFERIRL
jgi:hypothetical protein